MPIWLEVIVLLLVAYGFGVALGWVVWGRARLRAFRKHRQKQKRTGE